MPSVISTYSPSRKMPQALSNRRTIIFVLVAVLQCLIVSGFQLRQVAAPERGLIACCATTSHDDVAPTSISSKNSVDESTSSKEYFVSEALFVRKLFPCYVLCFAMSNLYICMNIYLTNLCTDLGPAAQILTEAFYSYRTNLITFQIEKIKTALSLESTFDKQRINPMGQMFVACSTQNGKVLGFAEVDTCSLKKDCDEVKECGIDINIDETKRSDLPRPYMYNLAVDKRWQRKGIATALVTACEKFVANMEQSNDDMQCKEMDIAGADIAACNGSINKDVHRWIYLRVRKSNAEAISFYTQLGYDEIDPCSIGITKSDVNSNSAEEGELILMGKGICMDAL